MEGPLIGLVFYTRESVLQMFTTRMDTGEPEICPQSVGGGLVGRGWWVWVGVGGVQSTTLLDTIHTHSPTNPRHAPKPLMPHHPPHPKKTGVGQLPGAPDTADRRAGALLRGAPPVVGARVEAPGGAPLRAGCGGAGGPGGPRAAAGDRRAAGGRHGDVDLLQAGGGDPDALRDIFGGAGGRDDGGWAARGVGLVCVFLGWVCVRVWGGRNGEVDGQLDLMPVGRCSLVARSHVLIA